MTKKFQRLSSEVAPTKYQISLKPDIDGQHVAGEETINILINKAADSITLHALDVQISEVFWRSGGITIAAGKISYNTFQETAKINFNKKISGKGSLHLKFIGQLTNTLRGFYLSPYTHKEKKKHIITTQFEATDARRAFPCFDEPAFKAVFEVSLIIPKDLTAISNSHVSSTVVHDSGHKLVKFAPTPKMSTYLLAFIIGEFESVQSKSKHGTLIRIFTTKGKIKQAQFALDVAKRSLNFLNDYFNIKYPLPILDLIAVPDLSAGAMENWGAVTFREVTLLVDEKTTPFYNRQQVAEVIAHELVHQWFGNLVTMEWWTHLWLNESFAHYMSYVTVDAIFPQWNIWTKFVLSEQSRGLVMDSLHSTHPIEVEVNHPDEINQIFDAISYSKGASVLRMLAGYIGHDKFRDGLRLYLKKHSYKNTSSMHLWEAFEKVSKKPIRKLMQTWLHKSGYPLITAEATGNRLKIKQNKFTLLQAPEAANQKQVWSIPLQAQVSKSKVSDLSLITKGNKVIFMPEDFEYIKFNPAETGFYRTNYDPGLLARILVALEEKKLSAIDQLGVIRDLGELSKAGYIGTDVFLEALQYIADRHSYVTWMQVSKVLNDIHSVFGKTSEFQKFVVALFKPLIVELGFERKSKETQSQTLLRSVVMLNLAKFGDIKTIKFAREKFNQLSKGKKVEPDLLAAIYIIVAQNGSIKDYKLLESKYITAHMQEEQRRVGNALFAFTNKSLIQKALAFSLSEHVRPQDFPFMVQAGMANPEARAMVWEFIKSNWLKIAKKTPDGHLLSLLISSLSYLNNRADLLEMNKLFRMHNPLGSEQAVIKAREAIMINIAWHKRDKKTITQYLNQPSQGK